MNKHSEFKLSKHSQARRAPLWKWFIILLLVIAMPLFFWYYKMANLNHIIKNMPPNASTNSSLNQATPGANP